MKKELVILGAGKIGRMVCHFMSHAKDEKAPTYSVRIGDACLFYTSPSPRD